ncbi:hypothetical protein A0J61_01478 [Choanephora cucurbitarum]|uniref:Uncharacterized protein n=1 Tax=Choanephora cucurbitarum TaxID=101091 RepID=A0A1C7NMV7_9FUNG|nr:hypothetical protein A0J61_01478 [Choanephora cucurbitarum]
MKPHSNWTNDNELTQSVRSSLRRKQEMEDIISMIIAVSPNKNKWEAKSNSVKAVHILLVPKILFYHKADCYLKRYIVLLIGV